MKKPIRIVERKLGRENAWGQAFEETRLIEIDPRQTDEKYHEILVHEALHIVCPDLTEKQVLSKSKDIASVLWRMGYRRAFHPNPDRD